MKSVYCKNGFTIIELLIAISIITIGLLGVSSLVVQNIQVQFVNRNYLIGSMLAQEGLELVRNIRDRNWLIMGGNWYDYLMGGTPAAPGDGTYTIDYNFTIDDTPNNIDAATTRLYENGGFYDHGGGVDATPFSRIVEISNWQDWDGDGEDDRATVKCIVKWTVSGSVKTYVAETHLYNWR